MTPQKVDNYLYLLSCSIRAFLVALALATSIPWCWNKYFIFSFIFPAWISSLTNLVAYMSLRLNNLTRLSFFEDFMLPLLLLLFGHYELPIWFFGNTVLTWSFIA